MRDKLKKPSDSEIKIESGQAENSQVDAKSASKPRGFMIDPSLRDAVINLVGAGSYNNQPPVPSRDVVKIVATLNALKPFDLKIEQPPQKTEAGSNEKPVPAKQMQVFILDEYLRNTVVNLLGAGTFSNVPASEVIRIVGILNSLRPFDISTNDTTEKKEDSEKRWR